MGRRSYTMRARAEAVAERREQIFQATYDLFAERPYEEITLQAVADRAAVALKTVVRQFGSKANLVTSAAKWGAARESARREVAPGDVAGAVRVLADRYEQMADLVLRRIGVEERIPGLQAAANSARQSHLSWLAAVFAQWLPKRSGPTRSRRLLALFGATELYTYWSWRRRLGASRAEATAAMRETVDALLRQWS